MNFIENEEIKIYKKECGNCNKNIFCFNDKITNCPGCGCIEMLKNFEVLENPIEKVKSKCLIITESFGTLALSSYSNSSLLHIGISNSKKEIYNFWDNYKIEEIDSSNNFIWKSVMNIPLGNLSQNLDDDEMFDSILISDLFKQQDIFPKYDQFNNNCYAYICRFLNSINYSNTYWTKENLALNLLEPKLIQLDKFCLIYKKLKSINDEYLVEPIFEFTCSICDECNERILKGQRNKCKVCSDFDICDKCLQKYSHQHQTFKIL